MHSNPSSKSNLLNITLKSFFGFEAVLADELKELGYPDAELLNRAVQIKGTWEDVYELNLYCRCAISVLVEIDKFYIQSEEDLYKRALRIKWHELFEVHKTFAIKGAIFSPIFKNTHYPFLLIKDAIVDVFKDKTNERPNIDVKKPNILFDLYIKDKEVTATDVARVIETAKAVNIPTDQQLLHTVPQEFIVDSQEDVREPIGMSGIRLEVKVHIVTGAVSAVQNIVKCVRRCGLEVTDLILQPMASADAVLTADEKELGVVLVDIGGGTTDIAIFTEGAIRHTAVIPIAGDQITNDIAMALRTPTQEAEEIKVHYGIAKQVLADPTDVFDVPGLGDRGARTVAELHDADLMVHRPHVEHVVGNTLHFFLGHLTTSKIKASVHLS